MRRTPEGNVPVAVAGHDLALGATLRPEELAQRAVPGRMVTASLVRADEAFRLARRTLLKEGEPLLWGDVLASGPPTEPEADGPEGICTRAALAAHRAPVESSVEAIRARLAREQR